MCILDSKHIMDVLGQGWKSNRVTNWLNHQLSGTSIKFAAQIIGIDSVAEIAESPPVSNRLF